MKKIPLFIFSIFCAFLINCKGKVESIKPMKENITESVYASGIIKSKSQYQVFTTVNGILNKVYVKEGDLVKKGDPLFSVTNDLNIINSANAKLAADFAAEENNKTKLSDLKNSIDLAALKVKNDSLNFERQKKLREQNIGTQLEFEQIELAFRNSKINLQSLHYKFEDLKRQLAINADQANNNLQLSRSLAADNLVKSLIDGKIYSIQKEVGELVNIQMPLAIVGSANEFQLELQIDEYDVVRVKPNQKIIITLDSYKDKVFEGIVDKVFPIMNERSKTFTVMANFINQPDQLYPNLTVEANIVILKKENVLTIPRAYLTEKNTVFTVNGEEIKVTTGLKDYQKVEIISGIDSNTELVKPVQ